MKWKNLKDGRCPKCGAMLAQQKNALILSCSDARCTFRISEQRLLEILKSPPRSRMIEPEDNLERHKDEYGLQGDCHTSA